MSSPPFNSGLEQRRDSGTFPEHPEWERYHTAQGVPYYFNKRTRETTWDVPPGIVYHRSPTFHHTGSHRSESNPYLQSGDGVPHSYSSSSSSHIHGSSSSSGGGE